MREVETGQLSQYVRYVSKGYKTKGFENICNK